MDKVETVLEEVINDANDGIKYNGIHVKFHTLDKVRLTGSYSDVPVLVIKNKKEVINKLRAYLDIVLKDKKLSYTKYNIRKCISLLFANACYEDFSNPNAFIDNRINFYLNDDFLNNDIEYNDIVIKKRVQSIYKETPYAFKAYIKVGDSKYYLPSINYGISNDTCYIYSFNNGVNSEALKSEIESKYNPNLLSITIFLKELYKYGIGMIKVVSYMPMRDMKNILDDFRELEKLYNNISIICNPFDRDEYMHISVYEFKKSKANFNSLIEE